MLFKSKLFTPLKLIVIISIIILYRISYPVTSIAYLLIPLGIYFVTFMYPFNIIALSSEQLAVSYFLTKKEIINIMDIDRIFIEPRHRYHPKMMRIYLINGNCIYIYHSLDIFEMKKFEIAVTALDLEFIK